MNAILTASSFIFPLITFPYVSRILLPEGTGKVSFATSVISYFNIIAQLGIPTYGIRACAQVRDDKEKLTRTAQELLIINLVMTALSYVLLFGAIAVVPRIHDDKDLMIITSFTMILTTIGMEWLYKALEQYTYISIRSMVFKAISIVFMFLLIHSKSDYVMYGAISVFASAGSFVLNFINAHKYIGLKPVGNYNFRRHLKPVLVFFAMACASTIYTNLDNVMLGFMATDTDVGYYNAAVKIKTVLVAAVTSLGAVLLPRASYYVENHQMKAFRNISAKAIEFTFLISIPLTIYFMMYAKEGIGLLSGEAYYDAVPAMQIISPTVIFIGITNILGIQILVPLGREKIVLYSEVCGALTDLILNAICIPIWKSAGAAFGTLVAEAVVLIIQYINLKDDVEGIFATVAYKKLIGACLLAIGASFWVKLLHINSNFIVLVVSFLLFFGVYYVFLLKTKEPLVVQVTEEMLAKLHHKKGSGETA